MRYQQAIVLVSISKQTANCFFCYLTIGVIKSSLSQDLGRRFLTWETLSHHIWTCSFLLNCFLVLSYIKFLRHVPSVHTKHRLPAHISQLVECAHTLRISLSCLCWCGNPKGGCTPVWYNICRYLSLLCQAATHGRTQLQAVADRLSISIGDNNFSHSPVSETPWLEPVVEPMCSWQTFVSGQCVRNAMIVANTTSLAVSWAYDVGPPRLPRSRSIDDDVCIVYWIEVN